MKGSDTQRRFWEQTAQVDRLDALAQDIAASDRRGTGNDIVDDWLYECADVPTWFDADQDAGLLAILVDAHRDAMTA